MNDDCTAVFFDVSDGGAKDTKEKCAVYYGNVAKVTFDKVDKTVPGARAHVNELFSKAGRKWFDGRRDDKVKGSST